MRHVFNERFGLPAVMVSAPGRINLIGEHTDYNDGLVMPCAISNRVVLAARPNGTDRCNLVSMKFGEASFVLGDRTPGPEWYRYIAGVAAGLSDRGHQVNGFDLVLDSDIPAGAGLSSSAALCCGTGFLLKELFGLQVSRLDLALVAQWAEHEFAGLNCGIMDQYASLFGEQDKALLLDCRTLTHESLPLNLGEHVLLLVNSGVSHHLTSSEYNLRRQSCEEGLRVIASRFPVRSLRDVTPAMLETVVTELDQVTMNRCRYVVEEIGRTIDAAEDLRRGDLIAFGKKMFETHRGLSRDYEVSCEETDFLVGCAGGDRSVIGARMMGGGFGGCTLNLILDDGVENFAVSVREKYLARFKKEPHFYQVAPEQGVVRLS
ncbi:MAG: galactokinase [Bacteroidota bacterium]